MARELAELSDRISAWTNAAVDSAHADVAALLALPAWEWDAWLAGHPAARNVHTFTLLLDRAHETLDDDPRTALALTRFVRRHVEYALVPADLTTVRDRLYARALQERGSAFRVLGEMSAAAEDFEQAIARYSADALAALDLAAARRGLALVRHQLGDTATALREIDASLTVFRNCHHLAGVARSLLFRGAIEFECGATGDAAASFGEALHLVRLLGDRKSEARLLLNLGHCAEARGDLSSAMQHFDFALTRFADLQMKADLRRVQWGIARVLVSGGDIDQAVKALEDVAESMMRDGLVLDAYEAWLDLVETLVLAGRAACARELASDLVQFFSARGLVREAVHATKLLQAVLRDGDLTPASFAPLRDAIGRGSA